MFNQLLAAAAQAAPAAAGAAQKQQGNPIMSFMPIIIIMVVFMFFMSRSQKKQQQKRQDMIDHIVKGSKVLLASGICGVVDEVRDNEFVVEIASNVKVRVVKNGIAEVIADEVKEEEKKLNLILLMN